jgi:Pyridoxamine 5'-phosphate oxidase
VATKKISRKSIKLPKASRPDIPGYGVSTSKKGILPWKWAQNRLNESRQYWIATARPDGSPHLMIVWGLWMPDGFYFSTGKNSRKARNLAVNPHCVIGSQDSAQAVIVEGVVETFDDVEGLKPLFAAYKKKYKCDVSGMGEPFYRLTPQVAFGLIEKKFPSTATRWTFS